MSGERGITAAAIARPVGTLSITSLVIVLGLFFLDRLPIDLLPVIQYPEIVATVNWPGAAPEVMEQQVTRVLEASLAATENLAMIQSRASEGRTNVNLLFDYGTDIDVALQDAARNLELARTQLPADIEPPRLYKRDPAAEPVLEIGFVSDRRTPLAVRDWIEHQLVPQLQAVPGTGGIEVAGGQVREFQVRVDPDRLTHHGLSLRAIHDLLAHENVDIAAGWLTSDTFAVQSRTDARLRSVSDVEALLVPLPGATDHVPLRELAEVRDTHAEERIFVRLNGQSATRVSVMKLPDANTLAVIDGVHGTLRRLEQSGFLPDDIQTTVTTDQSFFIRSSIRSVATAALLGGVLAMVVVLLFLGSLRKAFIIGTAIPVSILATFALMGLGGLTLNVMTLGGLALGVGLLLDNAIVMLENIFRHQQEYERDADDAARTGAAEVRSALIASTLTNLAAVVPFLLISGLAAMLFRELILTITFAILASLAAALTLVPSLAALLSRIRFRSGLDRFFLLRWVDRAITGLGGAYVRVARVVFRLRLLLFLAVGAALFWAWQALDTMGTEFLPSVDDGRTSVGLFLPPGAPPATTLAHALQKEEVLAGMPHVAHVFGLVGGHLGGGILNERPGTSRYSVQLTPASERPDMPAGAWVAEIQERMRALDIPGARVVVRPPQIPGIRLGTSGSAISIAVVGDDIDELDRIGRSLLTELEDIPGLTSLDISRDDRSPLLQIEIDRERAATLGFSPRAIAEAARDALHGSVPTRYTTGLAEYDVRVLVPRSALRSPDDLSNLLLYRDDGPPLRLGDVATFRLRDGPAHIERENQIRVLRLDGDINPAQTDVGTVNDAIRERVADLSLPDSYQLLFGGEEEVIAETTRALLQVILLALFLVFVVLATQYERLINPLVILVAAPLALVGVVALLALTETLLSAPVLLGAILLVGIVVNNAILLVEYIEIGRSEQGLNTLDATLEAGRIRLRPVLMTTATTVCGMLPLAIGMGDGAELMQPLAIAVVGGLLSATLLTLFVVPALYLTLPPPAAALLRWVSGSATPAPGPATPAAQPPAPDTDRNP